MKITLRRSDWHAKIYLFGLALLVCCLPLSRYLLSIAQFLLALNWLTEGNYITKFRRLRENPAILLFASVFLVYAAGLLFSDNMIQGVEKVKNALPIIMLPIVIGTSEKLSFKNIRQLLILFSSAVMAASLVCILNYLINGIPAGGDFRQISIFIPHIRFALLIVMAIAVFLYYALYTEYPSTIGNSRRNCFICRIALISASAYLVFFLFFLRSATGIAIFGTVVTCMAINAAMHTRNKKLTYFILAAAVFGFLAVTGITVFTWYRNFHPEPVELSALDKSTVNGNPYTHDTASNILENGNYTALYVCESELRQEWQRRSTVSYDGVDDKGQALYSTLMRYLTSKGLRKDSAGMSKLSPADISNIEKGLANYRFARWPGISQRLYETLYELHVYRQSGYALRHSAGQRLAFIKTGFSLAEELSPLGTGTGDVYDSMKARALSQHIEIDPAWEGKPHNQFLFLILAFGIPGTVWIIFCWVYPAVRSGAPGFLLFNLFICISAMSMLVMDTLESYDSVVFFTFFYCLYVFGRETANSYTQKSA